MSLVEKLKLKYFSSFSLSKKASRTAETGSDGITFSDDSSVSTNHKQQEEDDAGSQHDLTPVPLDLIDYLDDRQHHSEFALYLTKCCASENLSFLETIIIFHNTIIMCQNTLLSLDEEQSSFSESENYLSRLYSLKFAYLRQLNRHFSEQILYGNIDDISMYIYNKFIAASGDSCINISCDVRKELHQFFRAKEVASSESPASCTPPSSSSSISSIPSCANISSVGVRDDLAVYLNLFNAAILEIYTLLEWRFSTDFILNFNSNGSGDCHNNVA